MPPRKTKRQDGRFASTLRYLDPIAGHKKRAYFYGKTQGEARVKAERARHLTISQQWASVQPVRPLAALRVEPVDFPFLQMVNGHDEAAVTARAAADPDGFPWRGAN